MIHPAEQWQRLHPLSPVVRSGRTVVPLLFVVIASSSARSASQSRLYIDLAIVVLAIVMGVVSWLVTRWAFDGATLRFETGLLRRDARQVPVARIQAVDIVQPLLARFVGLAEVKITLAGGGPQTRLAYLAEPQADHLRAALLAAHHGQHPDTPEPAEVAGISVPTGRLAGSVALSTTTFLLVALIAALVVVGALNSKGLPTAFAVFFTYLLGLATATWRQFNDLYGFTVASAADGIRIRRGLLGKVSETIPVRRVQAVRQFEPLLWRWMGWCRLEVVLARTPGRDNASGAGAVRKTLLPVGSLQTAELLRTMVIGTVGVTATKPPRRARLKSPFSYHFLAAGHDDTFAVAVTGRVNRKTCWVPLEKVQSVRRVEGPVQRRLRLATVHVDVAGRRIAAQFRDRDGTEADRLVPAMAALSRVARRRALPEPRPIPVEGLGVPAVPDDLPAAGGGGATGLPPGGWYGDPSGRHRHRYWDGSGWTSWVHDEGQLTAVDPLEPAPS